MGGAGECELVARIRALQNKLVVRVDLPGQRTDQVKAFTRADDIEVLGRIEAALQRRPIGWKRERRRADRILVAVARIAGRVASALRCVHVAREAVAAGLIRSSGRECKACPRTTGRGL
jgi:hypothetical protein